MKSRFLRVAAYLFVCGALSVIALEVALRLYFGTPVFTFRDWRTLQVTLLQTGGARYDPSLGWTQASNVIGGGFNTLAYGIRKNSDEEEVLDEGGVLAVGDSYTAGSEVVDEDTWPAQLEKLLGRRVINAGVGNYGVDQTVLNAERLLPILKPRVVIIGIYEEDVIRVNYKNYSSPKPYFVRENGNWTLKNVPVPRESASSPEPLYKSLLSRFLSAHLVLTRFRDWWYSGGGPQYVRASSVPDETSCYLFGRLQTRLVAQNVAGIVVFQYGGWSYSRGFPRPRYVEEVLRCARDVGYQIVDEYEPMSSIAKQSVEALKENYVMSPDRRVFGHMSTKGNAFIAALIARELRRSTDLAALAPVPPPPVEPGDGSGINRIVTWRPENFVLANVGVEREEDVGAIVGAPAYRLTATSAPGEHYLVLLWSGRRSGTYTFSFFLAENADRTVRFQIRDDRGNGAYADYVGLPGSLPATAVGGATNLNASAVSVAGKWIRLSLSADLIGRKGSTIVQLMPRAGANVGSGDSLMFQGPMVEYGRAPSAYCRPGKCLPAENAPR
jgi:hypothetical protein